MTIGESEDITELAITFCFKGFTRHEVGFSDFYEQSNSSSGRFLGRVDGSSIRNLQFQLVGSKTWMTTWDENIVDDGENSYLNKLTLWNPVTPLAS